MKAKDKGTSKEQHITIQGSTGLSKEEVEKMRKDAEINAEADKAKRETVEIRNNADALVFNLEKQIRENDAKIPDELKKKVNLKIAEVKDLLKKEDATSEAIKKATDELGTEAQEIGKIVYEQAQKDQAAAAGDKKDGKDGAVDAEVVDNKKDEEKKGE